MKTNSELYHYGVKGMRWGLRKAKPKVAMNTRRTAKNKALRNTQASSKLQKSNTMGDLKNKIKKISNRELGKRGRAAIDVLMNGDKDWMGNSIISDNPVKEARNRGKAALERLMYSEEQISNKKFFGKYEPFS